MVRVRHGKGDRARTVAIDPTAQVYVERWLAKRDALGLNGRQPFVLHDHPQRPVRCRPRLLLCSSTVATPGRPGWHRASRPPACTAPLARDRAGARREDVAGDQRPARALVNRGDRPLPTTDRPDRARRRGPRPRTPRVNGARETPPPALGGKRSGGSRARRGGGRVYPHRLIPIPPPGVLCDGWGCKLKPYPRSPLVRFASRGPSRRRPVAKS